MEAIQEAVGAVNSIVWGVPMLILIGATGVFLMAGLLFMPLRKLVHGFKLLIGPAGPGEGDVPPFKALMMALSATVGTGNIAGVATAIFLGGPGAIFYMWVIALIGMATKYAEAVCAVTFRETDANGNHVGGPMYYLKNGVGEKFPTLGKVLAPLFALFAAVAAFGIGNGVQANSVADAMSSSFGISHLTTGIILMAVVAAVLLGGIKRIGDVAGALVPLMIVLYVGSAVVILGINAEAIPGAFSLIFTHAFEPASAAGGFAGATVAAAIRFGVARGVFSNEAGLGSAAIAHAAAKTNDPVRQGHIAMLGTFIDTIIVCTMTALVIITSGLWTSGDTGAALTSASFATALPGGAEIVSIALAVFAFTTILGWSYYGERSVQYLLGDKAILPYRVIWIAAIPVGASLNLGLIWLISDTLNAMMAIPNLIGLIILGPMVFRATKAYWEKRNGQPQSAD
jgi:alanine or glycine:cation symporter, AGCS family